MITKLKTLIKKVKLKKKLIVVLVALLSTNSFGSIIASAATGNAGVGLEFISGITAPPITIDGEIGYCLNLYKGFPVSSEYSSSSPYEDDGISAILYHGYPVNKSGLQGKYGLTNEQARYYTQVAIWQYLGDLADRDRGVPYLNELIAKAKAGDLGSQNFAIGSTNVEAKQMGGYQETQQISTSGSSGTFTFPSDANVWSVDVNGNKKNVFNIGESFKVRANTGFNGEKTVAMSTSLKKPAALQYTPINTANQSIVKFDWGDPLQGNSPMRIRFSGTGKIILNKTDDLGNALPGVKFGLFTDQACNNKVKEAVTNNNGVLEFNDVIAGKYFVKELETLKSHVLSVEVKEVNVVGGDTQTVNYTNNIIKGRVKITKVDEETGEKLQGAEFELRNKATGQVVEKLVTAADGTATSGLHPYAEYILKETTAPGKYTLNGKEYFVTINKDLETIEVTHQNRKIKGRVEIIKEDSEIAGLKIPGAIFGIYDGNTLVEELTTDENGRAISGLLNYGDYKLREISPAKGYRATNKEWNIQIREDQKTYTYNITNDVIKAKIQIVKVDSKQADKPVEGAVFDVLAKSVFGIKPGTVVDTITTDKNGFAFTKDLRRGDYDIVETSVGNDYYLDKNKHTVSIAEHGKTVVKHIKNEPVKMKLRVVKIDGETKLPIKNTKFKIIDKATGEDVKFTEFFGVMPIQKTVFKTNENGEIVFSQDLKAGNYSLVETEAAKGYKLIDPIDFSIDRSTDCEEIELLGKIHTIEVENSKIKGNLKIIKIDEETKDPLEGVKFKITCIDGFMKGKEWINVTDKKGEINLKDLEHGKYEAEEVEGLWNYVENKKPIKFEITEDGKTIEIKVTNKKIKGSVELIKIDSDTKRPLQGAKFELWNEEKLIGEFITNEKGKIVVENLEAGNYLWKEKEAPENYIINKDAKLDFNIYEDNQKVKITAENKVKEGEIDFLKTDVSNGELIDGAKIQIKGLDEHNKHIKIEFISSKEGNKFKVPVGRYEFREILPPDGYVLDEEVGTFEIKENEVIKAELKNKRVRGELEFTKIDVSTGEVLEGAKIKIECIEGFNKGKVIEFISSKEGNKFTLEYGKYRITEIMAPKGYELSTEVKEFEIKENGQIVKAKLENKRIPRLPNTGDESSVIIFAGTLIISLIGIGLFAIKNKKA